MISNADTNNISIFPKCKDLILYEMLTYFDCLIYLPRDKGCHWI